MPNYIGRVPNCRPECTIDAECPSNAACINERCKDPCQGACGTYAICVTVNHNPICSCQQGYTGDASSQCRELVVERELFLYTLFHILLKNNFTLRTSLGNDKILLND